MESQANSQEGEPASSVEPKDSDQTTASSEVPKTAPLAADITATSGETPTSVDTQPAVGGVGEPSSGAASISSGRHPKRWIVPAAIILVILGLLSGGYVFGIYLPNRPSSLYATSLKRSGEALDALVQYSNSAAKKDYQSYTIKGTMHATGTASFDATLTGALDVNGNSTFNLGADVLGEKLGANFESVHVAGSATPDVYVQLSGVKQELDSFGLGSLDYLDGQWIGIDHTLIDSYVADLNKGTSAVTGSSALPTMQQVSDALTKVQAVNKQYIFTTDPSHAVLANEKLVGRGTMDGRAMYHYTVGYDRAHLQAYLNALGTALDNSSLSTWSKTADDGKTLSQVLDIDSLRASAGNANAQYTFDVWVDAKTKLLHAVQFTDPSDRSSSFMVSQNYTGGSSYPFALAFNGKDPSSGTIEKAAVDVTLNTSTDVATGTTSVSGSGNTSISSTFTLTPSKNDVQVTAPAGAKPLVSVLAGLGLSGSGL